MNYKKVTALLLASFLTVNLSACGQGGTSDSSSDASAASSGDATIVTTDPDEVTDLVDVSDMFTDRDLSGEYDSTAVAITLSDSGSSCDSGDVTISGDTITITKEGTYLLSGSLSDGQIIVDAKGEKVQLVLDGVSISNSSSAAVYVRKADKVFLTLADGSTNSIATTG
jgi:ABC-type Fe3+-hydroxamate transport system substrate-binding protein